MVVADVQRRSLPIREVTDVVRSGLCTGCGLCSSVAGPDTISMGLNMKGTMRPFVRKPVEAGTNRKILGSCPCATLTGPGRPAGVDTHPVWGPVRDIHRSWSAEPEVRYHGAAGGTLTSLGRYLLDSGRVSAILHIRASTQTPWLTEATVSRTPHEVFSGVQSRYGPAASLVHVKALLDAGETFAVIAKPCDISAVQALARVDDRVDEQVKYLLTNFCGGIFNAQVARAMIRYHGVDESEVDVFRFRGEGWPGPHRTHTKDEGSSTSATRAPTATPRGATTCSFARSARMRWGSWRISPCRTGGSSTTESRSTTRRPGGTWLSSARTVGSGSWPMRSRRLHRARSGLDDRAGAAHRKVGTPGAFLALRLLRQPRPRVTGYRPLMSARRAGVRILFQAVRRHGPANHPARQP